MICSFSASRKPERVYFNPLEHVNLFLYSHELVQQRHYSPPEIVDMIFLRLDTLLHGLEVTRDCDNSTREQLRKLLRESVELLDQVLGTVDEVELLPLIGKGIGRLGFDVLKRKARGRALEGLIPILVLHAANPVLARPPTIADNTAELTACKQLLALVAAGNFAR